MGKAFSKILDECVDRINRGETVEDCLATYPKYAEELEPLLRVVLDTQTAYRFIPSPTAKMAGRQRFNAALEALEHRQKERQPWSQWFLGRSRVWATAAVVLLIALAGYFGLRPMLFPIETIPEPGSSLVAPSPQPSPEGNFVFLISDEVNVIGDFESLNVTISKIGLQAAGESERWVEFDPEIKAVDLTQLQGDKAHEIWRGDVPAGQYSQVFIYVSEVRGKLKATGQTIEIKLPSHKLHMSKPFQVTADTVTIFTYDLTVVATGHNGKYILKPQIDQSDVQQKPSEGKGKGKK
jgi:hypothetical protein